LLSSANSGPDTNSGHFSIVVSPAHHLDGSYTIFGELVSGTETMWAINKLNPPRTDKVTGNAMVTAAGCLRNCDPLNVQPKCTSRGANSVLVQRKKVHPCLD